MAESRRYQKGQALTETVAGIVGLMAVFMGLLFVTALGIENVEGLIMARSGADRNAIDLTVTDKGNALLGWSRGDDNLMFTADDIPIKSIGASGESFLGELESSDGTFNLASDFDEDYTVNNFAEQLPVASLFLWCANLTSYRYTNSDPLASRELEDIKKPFEAMIYNSDYAITETVYMPVMVSE